MACDAIEAIADNGYYKGEEIFACEKAGIAFTVSKPHMSSSAAHGRFDRAEMTPASAFLQVSLVSYVANRSDVMDPSGSCAMKVDCSRFRVLSADHSAGCPARGSRTGQRTRSGKRGASLRSARSTIVARPACLASRTATTPIRKPNSIMGSRILGS